MTDTDSKSKTSRAQGPTDAEFSATLDDDLDPDHVGGYGIQGPSRRPGAADHSRATGDGKDSQYGAAPVKDARYRDGSGGTYGQGEGQTTANAEKTRP